MLKCNKYRCLSAQSICSGGTEAYNHENSVDFSLP